MGASTTSLPRDCADLVPVRPEPMPDGSIIATSPDGMLAYTLGPVGFDGSALGSADAVNQESWGVNVRARKEAVDEVNTAFNDCYEGAPSCPSQSGDGRGSIAIVFDGAVISAPAVNGPDLGDGPFTISGDFTQAQAEDLANALFG